MFYKMKEIKDSYERIEVYLQNLSRKADSKFHRAPKLTLEIALADEPTNKLAIDVVDFEKSRHIARINSTMLTVLILLVVFMASQPIMHHFENGTDGSIVPLVIITVCGLYMVKTFIHMKYNLYRFCCDVHFTNTILDYIVYERENPTNNVKLTQDRYKDFQDKHGLYSLDKLKTKA